MCHHSWHCPVQTCLSTFPTNPEQFAMVLDPLKNKVRSPFVAWRIPWTVWGHKESDRIEQLSLSLFLLWLQMLVAQLCPTLCNSKNCSPPGSSVHGISQARILQWVANSFSRGSSWPRDWTQVSNTVGRLFTIWVTRIPFVIKVNLEIWERKLPTFTPPDLYGQCPGGGQKREGLCCCCFLIKCFVEYFRTCPICNLHPTSHSTNKPATS